MVELAHTVENAIPAHHHNDVPPILRIEFTADLGYIQWVYDVTRAPQNL